VTRLIFISGGDMMFASPTPDYKEALMPEITPSSAVTVVQQIPVDQIKPSRHQARKDFDDESTKQLADSIDKEGLIQPITVRKVGEGFELIAGERRLRAVKSLGWPTIEARVIEVVSEAAACAKGLVENLQRKDLNPIEEAEGFLELNKLDPTHWTHDEIAKVAGRSRVYITQSLGFLQLPTKVRDYVSRLTLTRSHALEIMRLPADRQEMAADKIKNEKLSREQTRTLVDQMLGGKEWPKITKILKAGQEGPKQGFSFSRKGANLAITAPFPESADLDKFLTDLRKAFLEWSSRTGVKSVPATSPNLPGFPKTPEELAELEKISITSGPKAVYDRIYGPDSSVTQAVTFATWEETGQTPTEGLHNLLEGIRKLQAAGVY
jgi:ParB/RepB/Spo0J family partition protein